jgi:histidinol-phosphatase
VPSDYTDDLRLAHLLADDADSISSDRFKALDLHVMTKPDLTPVSDADQAVEESIRRTLSRTRSRDAVTGEETGSTGSSNRRWIIDPIDGTKNYVRGVPVWATLIALAVDDEVVMSVVSAPQLGRRWWAAQAQGSWTGKSLMKATRNRAYGDFWSYMLLAEGAVDIAAEPELALYDMAALVPIVTEAGGTFTSLDGSPGPWGGNAVASNTHLHEAALSFLGSLPDGDDDPDWPTSGPGTVTPLHGR